MEDFGDEGLVGDAEGFGFLFEVVQVLAVDADVQDGVLAARGDGVRKQLCFVRRDGHVLPAQQRFLYTPLIFSQLDLLHRKYCNTFVYTIKERSSAIQRA